MKQFTAIFLILIYFGAFSGTTVNLHYCMGEYQSAEIFDAPKEHHDKDCPNCGMANKKDCCEHRTIIVKAKSDSYFSNNKISFDSEFFIVPTKNFDRKIFEDPKNLVLTQKNISPPAYIPLYILNSNYRI